MSPFLHSRFIICLLFLVSLGLSGLPNGASAQTGTSLPSLSAAAMTAVPQPFITVSGEGFTKGGLVFVALYDQFVAAWPSPVVALNRAVAVAELHGAEAGLAAIAELAEVLDGYQPFHATRAELLARIAHPDAAAAYDRAIELSTNATERRFLEGRRAGVSR